MKRVMAAIPLCLAAMLQPCAAQTAGAPMVRLEADPEGDGPYMIGEPIFVQLDRRALSVIYEGRTSHSGFLDTCPGGLS
jgi:hypothetical protein